MKKNFVLDNTDRIAVVAVLFVINVILMVLFFKQMSDYGSLTKLPGCPQAFITFYVIGIIYGIVVILLYLASFLSFVVKVKRLPSGVIVVAMFFIMCLVIIFLVRYCDTSNSILSFDTSDSEDAVINGVSQFLIVLSLMSLIFPIIITIINAVLMRNVGEVYFSKNEDAEDELQEEKEEYVQDDYEKEMRAKLEKVRSELRIKELEKEYMNLQNQLKNSDKDK